MLQSVGWQRVGHDLVTEQQHTPISLKGQLKGIQAHWEWKLWHPDLGALCPQVSIQWTSVEWMNELYINYRLWPLYFLYVSYFRILKNKSDWLNPDNIYNELIHLESNGLAPVQSAVAPRVDMLYK